ncbi:MAG: DUF4349 domain-containing protein [Bacteroidota bacterium]
MSKISLPYILFFIFFFACESEKGRQNISNVSADEGFFYTEANQNEGALNSAVQAPTSEVKKDNLKQEKKIIKTANLRFQVLDIANTSKEIERIVADSGAIIISNNQENYTYQITYNLTIRVENHKFEGLINSLVSQAGYLNNKAINSQDITEEFVDITARLATKKQIEARYLEILEQAKNIEDILEVEKKLGEIREEVEATEGRLRYLNNQVAMSTINLSFYQTLEQEASPIKPGFLTRIGKGFRNGWDIFLDFIVSLSYLWPFIIIGIISSFVIRGYFKRRKNRKALKA